MIEIYSIRKHFLTDKNIELTYRNHISNTQSPEKISDAYTKMNIEQSMDIFFRNFEAKLCRQ